MKKCAFVDCNCEVAEWKNRGDRVPKYCLNHRGSTNIRYKAIKEIAIKEGILPNREGNYKFIGESPEPILKTSKTVSGFTPRNCVSDFLMDIGEGRLSKKEGWKLLKGKVV